jgi:hypothetical protein
VNGQFRRRVTRACAVAAFVICAVAGVIASSVSQAATYTDVPGSPDASLNQAAVNAQGSQYTQNCSGLPIPVPQGGVVWHFVLPQNAGGGGGGGGPKYIFTSLTLFFQNAGTVTVTSFGPPDAMHAYVSTPTDDVLLGGVADGATTEDPSTFPETFNLSHTCASQQGTTTTSSSTTSSSSTTAPTTTSTTASTTSTTIEASTTLPSTSTSTTVPETSTTVGGTTVSTEGSTSTTEPTTTTTVGTTVSTEGTTVTTVGTTVGTQGSGTSAGGVSTGGTLPRTGGTSTTSVVIALFVIGLGLALRVAASRRVMR